MADKETGEALEEETVRKRRRRKRRPGKKHMIHLTERDLFVLRWIGEQYAVTLDHLSLLLGMMAGSTTKERGRLSPGRVRVMVARWETAGLVQSRKMLTAQMMWVWLTRTGIRQAQVPFHLHTPGVAQLTHYYAVNQIRLLLELVGGGTWCSERQLRAEIKRASWQGKAPHTPDGEWLMEQGERLAIEVELFAKTPRRIRPILESLSVRYSRIWYVVSTTTVQHVIEAGVASLEPEVRGRFLVRLLDELEGGFADAGASQHA